MRNIQNAVTDTLEELELEDYIEAYIQVVNGVYHVTFQEKRNGNNRVVISVVYYDQTGEDLLDDEQWEEEVDVNIVTCEGMRMTTANMLLELLAINLDEDYFASDEEDSDDETEPRTPPPRVYQPLVPRLQLPQQDLP